jgi:hypothetical protein
MMLPVAIILRVPPYTGAGEAGVVEATGLAGVVAAGEVPGLGEAGVVVAQAGNSSITRVTRAIRTQIFFT